MNGVRDEYRWLTLGQMLRTGCTYREAVARAVEFREEQETLRRSFEEQEAITPRIPRARAIKEKP